MLVPLVVATATAVVETVEAVAVKVAVLSDSRIRNCSSCRRSSSHSSTSVNSNSSRCSSSSIDSRNSR